jgi:hypothetical protein
MLRPDLEYTCGQSSYYDFESMVDEVIVDFYFRNWDALKEAVRTHTDAELANQWYGRDETGYHEHDWSDVDQSDDEAVAAKEFEEERLNERDEWTLMTRGELRGGFARLRENLSGGT